ncbi:uncharacterized protein LOC130806206 [Amaranthus tricolor]|uniref:uncharacterized protein LOC130806206 n=1 Tax=Amaranthus tricolor TaxID=29722 RepID=UPI00258C70AE|nr:uncharacterized protein LOC130806206 [Amaranthus tricolor]
MYSDDNLDFEFNDPPILATKKRKMLIGMDDHKKEYEKIRKQKSRKTLIGLDDLFNDHKKEHDKIQKIKSKPVKASRLCDSDDDEANETENKLSEALHDFKKTICEVDGHDGASNDIGQEDTTPSWGLQVFGTQRTLPPLAVPQLEDCALLQNSLKIELNSLLDHSSQMGETFLKRLLLNGWLSKVIITCGYLEKSISKWTMNVLLYSTEESLMDSACDFWSSILCNKVDAPLVKVEWLPSFLELNRALQSYGFEPHSSKNMLSLVESSLDEKSKECRGPPANIRAWIKIVDVFCQARGRYLILSTSEAEELITLLMCLFLERKLLGLTRALHDCLLSAINFFEKTEWCSSCMKVAKEIVERIPRDLNCLKAVDCISGVDSRSKQLRSVVAFQFLTSCYSEVQLIDTKDVLNFLISKNLKDKKCNLFEIYLCLVLTENCLLFGTEPKPLVSELWSSFIRKCSIQISNTDFRPCAQEIRNRASYLLHSTIRD